jgi:hypothetical protein
MNDALDQERSVLIRGSDPSPLPIMNTENVITTIDSKQRNLLIIIISPSSDMTRGIL